MHDLAGSRLAQRRLGLGAAPPRKDVVAYVAAEVHGVTRVNTVLELFHIKLEGPGIRLEHGQHDAIELELPGDALQQVHDTGAEA